MTSTIPPKPTAQPFDPDLYRMSIGEHLEELRRRMILGLLGFAVALGVCLFFGGQVVSIFCRPMYLTLQQRNINPQLYYTDVSESFMVYLRISLIVAAVIAGPWMLYQLWQFVAAGLYPHERKYITRYLPLSLTLLVGGWVFVYFLVLPWTLQFFVDWGNMLPIPQTQSKIVAEHPPLPSFPVLDGDPRDPQNGQCWFNTHDQKLKFHVNGKTSVLQFLPESLVAPHITLDNYIDLVVGMLLVFGLSFQLPLVVMALAKIGIVEIDMLKGLRRYVYFGMCVLAAAITPGDVITATVALMIPLILLYELGIFLAREPKKAKA